MHVQNEGSFNLKQDDKNLLGGLGMVPVFRTMHTWASGARGDGLAAARRLPHNVTSPVAAADAVDHSVNSNCGPTCTTQSGAKYGHRTGLTTQTPSLSDLLISHARLLRLTVQHGLFVLLEEDQTPRRSRLHIIVQARRDVRPSTPHFIDTTLPLPLEPLGCGSMSQGL